MAARKVHHKFTVDRVDRLMRGIRMGATYELACMHAGITFETFLNWKKGRFPRSLNDEEKELKANFLDILTRAEGDAAARHLSTIMQAAAQGDWKASAWALERRWPQHYGKQTASLNMNVEVDLNQYVDQVAKERGLTDTEREQLFARISEHLKKSQKGMSR